MTGTHDNPKTRDDAPEYNTGDYVEMFIERDLETGQVWREVIQIDECLNMFRFSVRLLNTSGTHVIDGSRFRW